jgi:hypothetical protein
MNRPSGIPLRPDRDALASADRRSLHRAVTALALANVREQRPETLVRAIWPDDAQASLIVKAAVSPTSTSSYPQITTATVLPALAPASASARLFARCLQIDLAGVAKVRVPFTVDAPQPTFVGEGSAAPVAQYSLSGVDCGPARKILILAAVTGELENATPETASVIIGKALSDATQKSVDAAVFSNVAADATRPAGLLLGITPIAAASTGSDTEKMATDIAALAGAIGDADIAADDMVIVASVAQATKLRLLSSPNFTNLVIGTKALADGTIVGIAPSGVAVGYSGSPEVETSRQGLVHFEDTTPLPIATGVQGSGVLATPTKSVWQTDMIVIKVRARTAWAALPGAIAMVTGVGW